MTTQPNQSTIVGNIGNDLVLNKTANQISVCNIRLGNTKQWNQKLADGSIAKDATGAPIKLELTTWVDVVAWGGLAETCVKYLVKGRKITVYARLEAKPEWTDKHGQKRNDLQLVAYDIDFGENPQKYINHGYQMGLAAQAQGVAPGTATPGTIIQPAVGVIKTGHPDAKPAYIPNSPVVFQGTGEPAPEDVGAVIPAGQQLFMDGA